MKKIVNFDEKDLDFVVEAWEREEDEDATMCNTHVEGEMGGYVYESFPTFDEACRKYVELLEKGWDRVLLKAASKERGWVDFTFTSGRACIIIDADKLNSEALSKLEQIRKILEG